MHCKVVSHFNGRGEWNYTRRYKNTKGYLESVKNEFRSNNLPELEIRYGTKVGNGGLKRKRVQEDELAENEQEETESSETPGGDSISSSFSRSSGAGELTQIILQVQLPSQSVDISGGEILPFSDDQPNSQINIENESAETDYDIEVDAVKLLMMMT